MLCGLNQLLHVLQGHRLSSNQLTMLQGVSWYTVFFTSELNKRSYTDWHYLCLQMYVNLLLAQVQKQFVRKVY